MAWIYLLLAGMFEIGFAIGLKYTEGFTRLWPSVGTVIAAAHQPVAADPGLAHDSRRHGLRDLDRHRCGGRGHAGRHSFFGKRLAGAAGLHRTDRGGRGRAEVVLARLTRQA